MCPKRNTGETTPAVWRCLEKQAKSLTKGLRRCWRLIATRRNLERDRVMVAPSVKVFVRGRAKSPLMTWVMLTDAEGSVGDLGKGKQGGAPFRPTRSVGQRS
jgi:hypothetical protein